MNIYQSIIIILSLSQPFLCISSEFFEFSNFQWPTEKLKFPDDKLQQYARRELEKKYPTHSFLKNHPATPQTSMDQKLDHPQKLIDEYKEKNLLFQKLRQEQIQLQEEIELKKQRVLTIAQKEDEKRRELLKKQTFSDKKTVSPKPLTQQPPRKPARTPAQQRYDAFKLLCYNYGAAPTKADLCSELTARCDKIYNNEKSNDSLSGPYFDQVKHVLSGAIDATWSFAYCPCDGTLKYLNITFCNLSQSQEFFNTCCTVKNCNQYKMDSYSPTPESVSTQEDGSNQDNSTSSGDEVIYGDPSDLSKEESSRFKEYLLKKYNAYNRTSLIAKLKTLCADNPHGPELCYNPEDRMASGPLMGDWMFQVYFDSGEILFYHMARFSVEISHNNGSSASCE